MGTLQIKEKDIQRQIMEYLTLKKIFHYRNNSGGTLFPKKDGGNYFIRFGALGSPDIVCVIKGQYVGVEVKGTKGKQSDNQKKFQEELEKAGGKYILTDSLEKLINELKWK